MTYEWTLVAADHAVTDTGGLTQPWATVIAAAIAVAGALVAFCGVWRTTDTTRKENRRAERVAVPPSRCRSSFEQLTVSPRRRIPPLAPSKSKRRLRDR